MAQQELNCEDNKFLTPTKGKGMYLAVRLEEGTGNVLPHTFFIYYFIGSTPYIHLPNNFNQVPS